MSTNNFLTNDEIIKLIKEHQEKKKDNSGILIKNYDKLLYKYASAFTHNKTFEYDDLIQEASIALIKAIDKFDINSEFKFITFASSYIKCQLLSYVNRQNLLYTPHNSKNKINRYLKQINELHIKLERKPTHEEILSLTNYSLKEIKFYEKQIALSTSLYMTTGDETMDDIISYIPDYKSI